MPRLINPALHARCREAARQLELLGCDTDAADAVASEFLPNGNRLGLVCADAGGSLSVMAYDAQARVLSGAQPSASCGHAVRVRLQLHVRRRSSVSPTALEPAQSNSTPYPLRIASPRKDLEAWGGKKLLRRGIAHVGALTTRLVRMRMTVPGDTANRQALLAATREGGIGVLASLWDEDMARRLASLQVCPCTVCHRPLAR